MGERKLLCIADETPESRCAVVFGAARAKRNNSKLVILRIIEPLDKSLLGSIGEAILDEVRTEAESDLQRLSGLAKDTSDIIAETLIFEGRAEDAIKAHMERDEGIKTLLLAAGTSRAGPGPLVSAALRGSMGFGQRPIAVLIVPGNLDDAQLIELAS